MTGLRSLRGRMAALLALFVLLLIALLVVDALREQRAAERAVERRAAAAARTFVDEHAALLEATDTLLLSLAGHAAVRAGDAAACGAAMRAVRDRYAPYHNIVVADAAGDVWCLTRDFERPLSLADRSYFQRALESGSLAVDPYVIGRLDRTPIMIAARPVFAEVGEATGEVEGAIGVSFDTSWFAEASGSVDLPEGASAWLVRDDGTVLAHHPNPERWVGETLPAALTAANVAEGLVQGRSVDLDGASTILTTVAFGGRLPDARLMLSVPTRAAFGPIRSELALEVAILVAALLGLTALLVFGADRLVFARLDDLVAITRQLAAGDATARSGFDGARDEVGRLGAAFDEMADALEGERRRREAARAELEREEERYRLLAENMSDMVALHESDGRYAWVSPSVEKLLGYTPEALLGTDPYRLFHPDDVDRIRRESHERALAGEWPLYTEYRIRRADGDYIWFETAVKPLLGEDGAATALQTVSRDVTARREAYEELERSNRDLEEFAYVASHDLQEPLRKIQAFGDRLEQRAADALDARSSDYLRRMRDASGRMRILIDDLLSFSRVSTHGAPPEPVELGQVLDAVRDDLALALREADGEIVAGALPAVEIDPAQAHRLLLNLVGNALKYRREGVPPRVEVRARPDLEGDDGLVAFEVRDNGIGFDPRYRERIFGVFQRLHGRSEYSGTGVGLAICRKIAERHGGRVEADAVPGEGASFVVALPPVRGDAPERAASADPSAASANESPTTSSADLVTDLEVERGASQKGAHA